MLRVNRLNKYYNRRKPNQIHVLKDVSIDFPKKGLVTILGASGSGKTTLLNVICGLDKTDSGIIEVDQHIMDKYRFNEWDHLRNQYFGYIFQNYNLFMDKTVYENVAISLQLLGISDQNIIKEQVLYTLKCVGMEKYKNRLAGSLSGGEQQRVAIARALVKDAQIIIADEPTGNLDEKNTIAIMNIIKKISQSRLVVLVTHERTLAHFYSDQIIEIKDGSIVKVENITENRELAYSDEKDIYLGDLPQQTITENDQYRITLYHDKPIDLDLKLIVDGQNLYLQAVSNQFQVKFIDNTSEVKLLEGHRPIITKENLVLEEFNILPLSYIYKRHKPRIRMLDYMKMGIQKLVNMGKFKKFMLLGFAMAAFLLCFALSSFSKLNSLEENEFMQYDRNIVLIEDRTNQSVEEKLTSALSLLERSEVKDLMANVNRTYYMTLEDYFLGRYFNYDGRNRTDMGGSIVGISYQNLNIIAGRMPANSREIVIDKMIFDKLSQSPYYKAYGTSSMASFLHQQMIISYGFNNDDLTLKFDIVGIADNHNMSIYVDDFYSRILRTQFFDYRKLADVDTEITNLQDHEILVLPDTKNIGETITLNNKNFTVKGYFTPKTNDDQAKYVITSNALRDMELYWSISNNTKYYVYSLNPEETVEYMSSDEIKVDNLYEISYQTYQQSRIMLLTVSTFFTTGVLIASLIYLYFLMRSSLISRINEIGIYRALGMTRFNIYLMFIAEIITLTTLISLPGYIIATLIINKINSVTTIYTVFKMNILIFFMGIVIIYILNLLCGLIPVNRLLKNTPREIISKYDI